MRKALNENPAVQAGFVAILLIVFAFIFFTRIMGGGEPPPAEDAATPAASAPASGIATATPPEGTVAPAGTAPAGDPLAAAAAEGAFVAGPGLPQAVVSAYADGKVIALLITRKQGTTDQRIADQVRDLRSRSDVAVFATYAKSIARYSRITNGVNVERTPALIVIKPRKASEGGPPIASVSYGFRGPDSVEQAVNDALYDGRKNLPYYPE